MQPLNLKVGTKVMFKVYYLDIVGKPTERAEKRIGKISCLGKGGCYIVWAEEVLDEGMWVMQSDGLAPFQQKFRVEDKDVLAWGRALEIIHE